MARQRSPLRQLARAAALLAPMVLVPIVVILAAPPLRADQNDPRLPGLFDQLLLAASPEAAAPIEQAIWQAWTQHSDPVIEQLMDKAALGMQIGDAGMAQRALDQVVALAPDYAEGWNRRATFNYMVGRYQDSLDDIEQVLSLEPRHFGALSGKGLVLVALERWEDAAAAFQAALAVDPQMQGAQENLKAVQEIMGRDI